MKKIVYLAAFMGTFGFANAQIQFSTSTGTYANLVGATNLSAGVIWDDPESDLNDPTFDVGFSVKGSGFAIKEITVGDGFLYFEDAQGITGLYFETTGIDLVDRGTLDDKTALSPISAQITGNAGNRIFKIEWKNFGFYGEYADSNTMDDYGNVQIWIYELDGKVEYRYGQLEIASAASHQGYGGYNVFAGVLNFNNFDFSGISLTGLPGSPSTKNDWDGVLSGFPENGRIYTFKYPVGASVAPQTAVKTKVYPVPAVHAISIELPGQTPASYKLYTLKGELVSEGTLYNNELNVSNLKGGMYAIQMVQDKNTYYSTFVKN